MHPRPKPAMIVIGVISGLVLSSSAFVPQPTARSVMPDVTVIHSSLINVSPPSPDAGELVTLEVSDPTVSGQFITNVEWQFPDGSRLTGAERTRVQHRFDEAGVYTVSLRMEALSPYQIIRASTTLNVRPAEGSSSPGGEVSARAMIKSYDANDDNRLDNAEFTVVIDAWVNGAMGNETFIEALDLWVHQETILRLNGSSSSAPIRLIHHGNRRLTIRASNDDATRMRLALYDQAGNRLLRRSSTGNRLTVDLQVVQGRRLPNGVYLAQIQVQGDDSAHRRAIKKLTVMR